MLASVSRPQAGGQSHLHPCAITRSSAFLSLANELLLQAQAQRGILLYGSKGAEMLEVLKVCWSPSWPGSTRSKA
jgi:hypothetical protein